jgi:DNA ligase-1
VDHLREELARVEALGGEGLMLRQPGSRYVAGRSSTLLKVKTFHDADARVIEHLAGAGRHKGRLGALLAELADGTQFSVGTGFSDKERQQPPAVGSLITFRYQELSDRGVPRFPSFVRVRRDAESSASSPTGSSSPSTKGLNPMSNSTPSTKASASPRRFEFVEGSSSKFWEIQVAGTEVTVRFGRIGTNGQTQTKAFGDDAAAKAHADKLIAEKTGKGYVERTAS